MPVADEVKHEEDEQSLATPAPDAKQEVAVPSPEKQPVNAKPGSTPEKIEAEAAAAREAAGGKQESTDDNKTDALEILEPAVTQKIWIIGKPPEQGGNENQWSRYVQRPLGYMARLRFFALVADVFSKAMREAGDAGFSDFGEIAPLVQRGRQLSSSDFEDASSFMQLAMRLMAVSPTFLLDCYVLWLDVPAGERGWAKTMMDQPYIPEEEKWGLTEDDGLEIVEIFIDQNYEDIRRFFTEKLPKIAERVRLREQERVRNLESAQSKP